MPSKFWTEKEKLIQKCVEETGLLYISQARFGTYDVDFYLPEIGVVVEADGPFGHLAKRDAKRDAELKDMGTDLFPIEEIWHFRENTLKTIRERLCQELNKLENSQ